MSLSNSNSESVIIESNAWPASCIYDYSTIRSGTWGTLVFYGNKSKEFEHFEFLADTIPSDDAIIKRWGKLILRNAAKVSRGELTYKHKGIKLPTQIISAPCGFFIGCPLSDHEAVKESALIWNSEREATKALLTAEWDLNTVLEIVHYD